MTSPRFNILLALDGAPLKIVISMGNLISPFFIEVKCCAKPPYVEGYFLSNLEEIDKYWDGTRLIIVNPYEPHFIYINLKEISESMKSSTLLNGISKETWIFSEEIKRDIKELFHELEDDKIKEAIECIIKKS